MVLQVTEAKGDKLQKKTTKRDLGLFVARQEALDWLWEQCFYYDDACDYNWNLWCFWVNFSENKSNRPKQNRWSGVRTNESTGWEKLHRLIFLLLTIVSFILLAGLKLSYSFV